MKLSDHEQVVLKAIEHVAGSRNGLASVPAVTRAVSYPISTTQKILAALHRKEVIALHHHDFPAQMTADEKKRAVKIGNDYFHAVAIRNPMATRNSSNIEKDILTVARRVGSSGGRVRIADVIDHLREEGYSEAAIKQGIVALGKAGRIALMRLDDPWEQTARDKRYVMKLGGQDNHIFYVKNPKRKTKRTAANPSPAQLKARAAFTRMAKERAAEAKKANPPGMGEKAGRAADAKVRKSINGYLAQGWDFQKIKDRVWLYYGYTLIALDAEKATFTSLFQKGGWILYLNPKRGGVSSVKTNPVKRKRAANPRYLVSATDARGNIADLGVLVSPNKTQAVARAKKLYKGYKKFTAAMVDKGDYIGPKGVVKIRRKRPTKKANGIAKTAGKAIKKVTRAVLGGVSKVAGKGAKALKNPAIPKNAAEYKKLESKYHAALYKSGRPTLETNAMRDAMNRYERIQRDLTEAKARQRYERMMGNPSRRRNLDHRDSSHQVKVHQHWRAGGLSQWQRAHHAGQHDLFSHGIKAKAKRNPRKKRSVDEQLKQAELRKLKLFGKALKAFPSSPRQKRIHRDVMRMHDLAVRLKAKKANPSASAIRKKFAGRVSGSRELYFPKGAPQGMAKLGRLVSIKLKGGKLIKPSRKNPSAEIWLCSDTSGKLWLGCTKAGPLYAGAPGDLGEMSMLEYSESKPHIGYPAQTIWFHKMGEVSGRRPHLIVNDDQDLLIKGGNYKITRAGIVD